MSEFIVLLTKKLGIIREFCLIRILYEFGVENFFKKPKLIKLLIHVRSLIDEQDLSNWIV